MSAPTDDDRDEVQAFLRSLVDEYGVDGLKERFRASIEEAEAGRVDGPAIEEATNWLESVHGERVRSLAGAVMLTATSTLIVGGTPGHPPSVNIIAPDVVNTSDTAAIVITETSQIVSSAIANLPTNMQVMAQVHDMFWYLLNAWSLLNTPAEVLPFALLFALAIVVLRIRLRQASG